jgi:hypothetical protein
MAQGGAAITAEVEVPGAFQMGERLPQHAVQTVFRPSGGSGG